MSFARAVVIAGTALALGAAVAEPVGAAPREVQWREVCRLDDDRLREISGMARSTRHPHVLWVNNDSGDRARVYAIDSRTCATVGEVRLRGVEARDFEGLASSADAGGRGYLWVGDIGDNRDSWPFVTVYRVPEPKRLGTRVRSARQWRFTYPDRPHNAETLMVDGNMVDGDMVDEARVWVATWQLASGGLYSVPLRKGVATARRVGDVGSLTTDGAIHPWGAGYVLRDYLDVHVFQGLPPGRRVATLALPAQVQGEAITWTFDGRGLFIASEKDQRLIRVELPTWVLASLRSPNGVGD